MSVEGEGEVSAEDSRKTENLSAEQEFENCKARIFDAHGDRVNLFKEDDEIILISEKEEGQFLPTPLDRSGEKYLITQSESEKLLLDFLEIAPVRSESIGDRMLVWSRTTISGVFLGNLMEVERRGFIHRRTVPRRNIQFVLMTNPRRHQADAEKDLPKLTDLRSKYRLL